ncbi:MAG: ATP-binding protein [Actinomycetota bacterium]|nr:ATP-binding protein [Actinomycetota bacterium]
MGDIYGARPGSENVSYRATSSFRCESGTPALARKWSLARIEEALADETSAGDTAELLDDAALIVSELVTNAVRAGCGRTQLEVAVAERHLRIAVIDDAPGVPVILEPSARDDHGRGLHIVAEVATDWGVKPLGDSKEVWATLPIEHWTPPHPLSRGAINRGAA